MATRLVMSGRIPETLLHDIHQQTDIAELIGSYLKLKKSGTRWIACCPFHHEKTPSFFVNPERQRYHCFGCGKDGDAIQFLVEHLGMSFSDAIHHLAERLGLSHRFDEDASEDTQDKTKTLYEAMHQAVDYYARQFKRHPKGSRAVDYLKKRGITGLTAKRFRLGYAPPGWRTLETALADVSAEQRAERLAAWMKVGLLAKSDGNASPYDRFRDRIIFPISDTRGRAIGLGGRILDEGKPKYLNSPETPLFHKSRAVYGLYEAKQVHKQGFDYLLVVEGYFDVISLSQAGITQVVATLGTALSDSHLEILFRHTSDIIFGFDGDQAGRDAAWKALQECLPYVKEGRRLRFIFFPQGEDPDSFLSKTGKAPFLQKIEQSQSLSDFLFEYLSQGIELAHIDGRAKLFSLVKPFLEKLPTGVYQQMMFDKLADLVKLEPNYVKTGVAGAGKAPYQARVSMSRRQKPMASLSLIERVVALLWKEPRFRASFDRVVFCPEDLPGHDYLAKLQIKMREGIDFKEALLQLRLAYPNYVSITQLEETVDVTAIGVDWDAEWDGLMEKVMQQKVVSKTNSLLAKARNGAKLSHAEVVHLNALLMHQKSDKGE